jgi:hypothetical protein
MNKQKPNTKAYTDTEDIPKIKTNKNKISDDNDSILNLKILGKIKKTDKLRCNNDLLVVDTYHRTRSLFRWWNDENRTNTIDKINLIIDEAFGKIDIIINNYNSKNSNLLQRFLIALTNSCEGIDELKISYINDINTKTKLGLILDKIRIKIREINETLENGAKKIKI